VNDVVNGYLTYGVAQATAFGSRRSGEHRAGHGPRRTALWPMSIPSAMGYVPGDAFGAFGAFETLWLFRPDPRESHLM